MTADALAALLAQGEGPRLEFKEDAVRPGDLAQTFVALANAQGGTVLLGVSDAGRPVGIRAYQPAYDLVLTAASAELCDPPVPLTTVEPVALPTGARRSSSSRLPAPRSYTRPTAASWCAAARRTSA